MSMQAKIALRGVVKRFGSKTVLDGVDLSVAPGESLVIIGGSGSGKSVTLKCILGLLRPEAGSIEVDGMPVVGLSGKRLSAYRANFGMLFQGSALFDSLPVWRNVAFGLIEGRAMPKRQAYEKAIETLARVGLSPDVALLKPSELSGGMQKRVGLARAIAARPSILFFDEPTTGLDPIMADVINELIVSQVKQLGCTALTITHDMSSVRKIADRVAMLYQGKVIWSGSRAQIDQCDNPYVEQFVHGHAHGPIQMTALKG
jgi:phospholipid/cholesterol/gamma-HCH transport system ATP-binding protein